MTTDEWVVRVVLATTAEFSEAEIEKMSDIADKRDATVARRAGMPGVVITMDVDVTGDEDRAVGDAVDWALALAQEGAGVGDVTPVDVRFMTLEAYEVEALHPDIPALASAADAAEILGVSRQRVHQLTTTNPNFPPPIARVATGPLWARSAIEWFKSVWERKSGRPAKRASVTISHAAESRLKIDPTIAARHAGAVLRNRNVGRDRTSNDEDVANQGRLGNWIVSAQALSHKKPE